METLTDYEQGYQDGWAAHEALSSSLIEKEVQERMNKKLEASSDYPIFPIFQLNPYTNESYPISIDYSTTTERNNEKHP